MFVLTEAVIRGINPYATQYLSAPFTGPNNWNVQTYEHTYSGRIPISQATLESDNTVYARLTLDLGPKSIADLASSMGIQSKLEPVPSIALGVNAISPLDLATAYATLAAGGVAHRPTILTKVVFPDGHAETARQPSGHRVIDATVAGVVTKILEANVQSGTGTAAALYGRPAAGKTGTTDSEADAWFAGWVPQLATVVWIGNPNSEKPMGTVHGISSVTGGTFPAMIWHTFMTAATAGDPVQQFANPGSPAYQPWCGRFQFALTWRNARPSDTCTAKPPTKTHSTATATQTTATTETHGKPPKHPKPPPPPPPPPPTTTTATTETTTTTGGGGG
jgi:penicillin-binding protein 1A